MTAWILQGVAGLLCVGRPDGKFVVHDGVGRGSQDLGACPLVGGAASMPGLDAACVPRALWSLAIITASGQQKSPPTMRRWGAMHRAVETLHRGVFIMSCNSGVRIILFVGVSLFEFGAKFGHRVDGIPGTFASLADDLLIAGASIFITAV